MTHKLSPLVSQEGGDGLLSTKVNLPNILQILLPESFL
jgi:hypothetical protein